MDHFLSKIASLMSSSKSPAGSASGDVAHQLMECAQASAGRDPHQAEELRSAACAYLSVIR
ncbi:MAG: hypothetical protein JWR60_1462 [Polaromonas sp.]|nr:hypothetical protein [Polaromonas sp.]